MNKDREDRLVMVLGCLLMFTIQFIGTMVIVALPSISDAFDMNVKMEHLINLVFLIASISLMLPIGKYMAKYGIGKYLKIGIVLMSAGLFMSAISWDPNMLLISRVIQGVATAIINGSVYVIVALQLPEEKLGAVLGIIGSCGYVGLCLSHTISGLIVQYLSWRFVFLILIPIYIIALLLLIKINKEWTSSDDEETDNAGSVIYFFFIALLLIGITNITTNWGLAAIIISAILLMIFIKIEKNKEYPVYNLSLFKNVKYVIGNYSAFIMYFMTFIAMYILNSYLQYGLHLDTQTTGFILFTTPIAVVVISLFAGRLSDRYDERLLSSIALTLILINVIIVYFMNYVPLYLLIIACFLQGIGHGLFSSPNNRFVLTLVEKEELPDASTILSTSKDIGKTLSLSCFTAVSVWLLGTTTHIERNIPELIKSSHIILSISIILGATAIAVLLISYMKSKKSAMD